MAMIELSGKEYQVKYIPILKEKISKLDKQLGLAVIQVGNDEASNVYVKQKEKKALELGYKFVHKLFREDVDNVEVINYINELNNDNDIDGIIVQMPLPEHLDVALIQNSVNPLKDVDGLSYTNGGKLEQNHPSLIPCTPKGIVALLDEYGIDIEGKNVTVVGRSILVGKPTALLLTNRNATVTLCHSKTKDVSEHTKNADIVIVAVGIAGFLKEDMVKDGAIVIDVGISRIDGKLYGDVDYPNVSKKVSYITPVPGGVGPMTVYELMNNVYEAYLLRNR